MKIKATLVELKEAFTEWERRYRENPEAFMNEAERLLKRTPKTYGDLCGPYFAKLLEEIQGTAWSPK